MTADGTFDMPTDPDDVRSSGHSGSSVLGPSGPFLGPNLASDRYGPERRIAYAVLRASGPDRQ